MPHAEKHSLPTNKDQLDALLVHQKLLIETGKSRDSMIAWIDGLPALIKLGAPLFAAFIWFQNNFATTKMYQELQAQIVQTNQRIDGQYKDLKELVDQRHREAIQHSDDNRERMISIMAEIKDSLKTLYLERQMKK